MEINKEMRKRERMNDCRVAIKIATSDDFNYSEFSKMQGNTSINNMDLFHEFYSKVYSTLRIDSSKKLYSHILFFIQNVGKSEALKIEVSNYSIFICPNQVENTNSNILVYPSDDVKKPFEGTARDYIVSGERFFLSLSLDNYSVLNQGDISAEQERKLRQVAHNHPSVLLKIEFEITTVSGEKIKEQCAMFGAVTEGEYLCQHSDKSVADILKLYNGNDDYITWLPYLGCNECSIDFFIGGEAQIENS
jgi:hypothetical protein